MADREPRILVVDDEERNLRLMEAQLIPLGYEVLLAHEGEEALRKVRELLPDAILLDIVMPKMDGFEVARQLREDQKTRTIPIVMLTALHGTENRIKGIQCGADDFLSKPVDRQELITRLQSRLRLKFLHDKLEQRNELLYSTLNHYVVEDISTRVLRDPGRYMKLGGEAQKVTVLFADIRGFTHFAESHSAKLVVEVLNGLFSELADAVFQHQGVLDKFMGDCLMAFFETCSSADNAAFRAAQTALEMQAAFALVQQESKHEAVQGLGLGIGMNTGRAIVGNVGSKKIMDYTVIGDVVNVAARLQGVAKGGEILMSKSTYFRVRTKVIAWESPPRRLRGKDHAVAAYRLERLR